MSDEDWKKTLPFKQHWLLYLIFKITVLALAGYISWCVLQVFELV
jgi:hypothetical protein